MSLTREVAALVEERGAATVDDLLPDLEEYTRAQVMSALGNAATAGLIVCDGPGPRIRRGSKPGVYRPKPQPQRPRPVASVWDFAQRASA